MTIYFSSGTEEYGWLSNFYATRKPHIRIGTEEFTSIEQAYQSYKAANAKAFSYVFEGRTPSETKRRGRKVVMINNWDNLRIPVMSSLVFAKFSQNTDLMYKLLDTKDDELVEYTTWNDTFWGVDTNYKGENNLGKILMATRHMLSINNSLFRGEG